VDGALVGAGSLWLCIGGGGEGRRGEREGGDNNNKNNNSRISNQLSDGLFRFLFNHQSKVKK
jgi:hypothetical protein